MITMTKQQEPISDSSTPVSSLAAAAETISDSSTPMSSLAAAAETISDSSTPVSSLAAAASETLQTANQNDTSTLSNADEDDAPLHAKWTLWYDNPKLAPAGADWKQCLHACGQFQTIGQFWRVFNNVRPASMLSANSNYSVFRDGIEPSWEDAQNVNGGKFVLTIPKKDSKGGKCDEYWLFTVLAAVGETMDESGDQVNGVVVSIRKSQDRIALWIKSREPDVCVDIGERWKQALNLEKTVLRYQTHKDAAASGRSFRNEVQFEV